MQNASDSRGRFVGSVADDNHSGVLREAHANAAADALSRLEDLCMEARATPPKRLIAQAVDMVVFIARREGGRVITEILEPAESEGASHE